MILTKIVEKLNADISNEYAHMLFYLESASNVVGLHRAEYSEFFKKHAASEMQHVDQFRNLIFGLGYDPKTKIANYKQGLKQPEEILKEALKLEEQVVDNYVERLEETEELYKQCVAASNKAHVKYLQLFLEEQLLESRSDVDELKQLLIKE